MRSLPKSKVIMPLLETNFFFYINFEKRKYEKKTLLLVLLLYKWNLCRQQFNIKYYYESKTVIFKIQFYFTLPLPLTFASIKRLLMFLSQWIIQQTHSTTFIKCCSVNYYFIDFTNKKSAQKQFPSVINHSHFQN